MAPQTILNSKDPESKDFVEKEVEGSSFKIDSKTKNGPIQKPNERY